MIFGLVFCPLSHTKRGVIGGVYKHIIVLFEIEIGIQECHIKNRKMPKASCMESK